MVKYLLKRQHSNIWSSELLELIRGASGGFLFGIPLLYTGEQQIDFLSGGEIEEGAFIFSHHPQEGKLIVRVASYKLP